MDEDEMLEAAKEAAEMFVKRKFGKENNRKVIKTFPVTEELHLKYLECDKLGDQIQILHSRADALRESFWSAVRLKYNLFACDLTYDAKTREVGLKEGSEHQPVQPELTKPEQKLKFVVVDEPEDKKPKE